jgi:hypothetical protein
MRRDADQETAVTVRFWRKVRKTDTCWEWSGSKNNHGYGWFRFDGKASLAHRVSWLFATGLRAPSSHEVCHTCDNPACVRPEHLFLGTHRENMRDMSRKGRWGNVGSRKTHCKRGHAFTPENTRIHTNGSRQCRECQRARNAA